MTQTIINFEHQEQALSHFQAVRQTSTRILLVPPLLLVTLLVNSLVLLVMLMGETRARDASVIMHIMGMSPPVVPLTLINLLRP